MLPNLRLSRSWKTAGIALAGAGILGASVAYAGASPSLNPSTNTATPIKHLVVLFDENETFDHYFGTYPFAANTDGVKFTGSLPTTSNGKPVNNYVGNKAPGAANTTYTKLVTNNPNSVKPFRLSSSEAWTCSQNHSYTPEQKAMDANAAGVPAMDKFPETTSADLNAAGCPASGVNGFSTTGENMGYYDGNTVTGLWNLAQNFAMSENSWDATFGPSTPGALEVTSGNTYGASFYTSTSDDTNPTKDTSATNSGSISALGQGPNTDATVGTMIGDIDPVYDDCSNKDHTTTSDLGGMSGKNIGDLLGDDTNAGAGVSWGYFAGGFTPTTPYKGTGTYAKCDAMAANLAHTTGYSYNPHHNPFSYYASTSNPHHLLPATESEVGHNGQANHQYDLSYFYDSLENGNLPAVSYVKPIYAQDGHPGNSDPLDEQRFIAKTVDAIEQSPDWSSTAIVIAYDDSDGWYDHQAPTIINGSNVTNGNGGNPDDTTLCSTVAAAKAPLGGEPDRCGPSQRLPFLVISPYAKRNYVSDAYITQASVARFIEDNWHLNSSQLGSDSFAATAGYLGGLGNMFDFSHPHFGTTLLRYDGVVSSTTKAPTTVKINSTAVRRGVLTLKATASLPGLAADHPTGTVTIGVTGRPLRRITLPASGQLSAVYRGLNPKRTYQITVRFLANQSYSASSATKRIKG